jgi:hypothetical protein
LSSARKADREVAALEGDSLEDSEVDQAVAAPLAVQPAVRVQLVAARQPQVALQEVEGDLEADDQSPKPPQAHQPLPQPAPQPKQLPARLNRRAHKQPKRLLKVVDAVARVVGSADSAAVADSVVDAAALAEGQERPLRELIESSSRSMAKNTPKKSASSLIPIFPSSATLPLRMS